MNTTRISVRLPHTLVEKLDEHRGENTRSHVINDCLFKLVHAIQCDIFDDRFLQGLVRARNAHTQRDVIYIRVPNLVLDYLKLNLYNRTSCIICALEIYI